MPGLNRDCFKFASVHPNVFIKDSNTCEAKRLSVETKLLVGTFILQMNHAKSNSAEVSGKCLLCHEHNKTIEHFFLDCPVLKTVRPCVTGDINKILSTIKFCGQVLNDSSMEDQLRIVLDCSYYLKNDNSDEIYSLEHHTRRLCFVISNERHKLLHLHLDITWEPCALPC